MMSGCLAGGLKDQLRERTCLYLVRILDVLRGCSSAGDPPQLDDIKENWEWLGRQKRLGHRPHEFPEGSERRGTYEAYQSILRQANALDFDDLLIVAGDLVREDPSIREKLRRRFRYMLVDEFQDSNPLQV